MVSASVRFWILIGIVALSGFSQGMLMPTIAIILNMPVLALLLMGFMQQHFILAW